MAYKWDNEAWKMITCWVERGTQDGFFGITRRTIPQFVNVWAIWSQSRWAKLIRIRSLKVLKEYSGRLARYLKTVLFVDDNQRPFLYSACISEVQVLMRT